MIFILTLRLPERQSKECKTVICDSTCSLSGCLLSLHSLRTCNENPLWVCSCGDVLEPVLHYPTFNALLPSGPCFNSSPSQYSTLLAVVCAVGTVTNPAGWRKDKDTALCLMLLFMNVEMLLFSIFTVVSNQGNKSSKKKKRLKIFWSYKSQLFKK